MTIWNFQQHHYNFVIAIAYFPCQTIFTLPDDTEYKCFIGVTYISPISQPFHDLVYYFHHQLEIYALLLRCSLYRLILIVTSVYQYTEGIGLLIDQWMLYLSYCNQGKRKIGKRKARNSLALTGITRVKE